MQALVLRLAPAIFVVLWSTGFVFSRLGAPFAEPATFLSLRFSIALMLLIGFCLIVRAPWPSLRIALHAGVAGALLHTVYLGGTLAALRGGMGTAVVALIASLQPVFTALVSGPLLGERVTRIHWLGLGLGLAGAFLVVLPKLELPMHGPSTGINIGTLGVAFLSLAGITAGTIYQKRFVPGGDLRTISACQFAGALLVAVGFAGLFETRAVQWTSELAIALAWLIVMLSFGAVGLLNMMIRENAVSRVASLFYLVPCLTGLLSWAMFNETLWPVQIVGMVLAATAVLVISRFGRPSASIKA